MCCVKLLPTHRAERTRCRVAEGGADQRAAELRPYSEEPRENQIDQGRLQNGAQRLSKHLEVICAEVCAGGGNVAGPSLLSQSGVAGRVAGSANNARGCSRPLGPFTTQAVKL